MECGLSSLPQCMSAITRPTLDNFIITPSPQKVNEGVEKREWEEPTG